MKWRNLLLTYLGLILLAGCGPGSGDRVLVAKYIYEANITQPDRQDVVVFRWPVTPIEDGVPTNYIKRLLGLAGETIAIFFGQLFTYDGDYFVNKYKDDRDPTKHDPNTLWEKGFTHADDLDAITMFKSGKFSIVRKKPEVMLALRRLVYDNDHQAKDLLGVLPPRWDAEGANWSKEGPHGFASEGDKSETQWLRYRHFLRPMDWPSENDPRRQERLNLIAKRAIVPQLITDFSGYNGYQIRGFQNSESRNWVGDLMLETQVRVLEPKGELWLELSQGVDRFQARWDLTSGLCTLVRLNPHREKKEEILDSQSTSLKGKGTFLVRFANFDERLTVWVNRELPFKDGVTYPQAWKYDPKDNKFLHVGPTQNDLQPASIAAKGAAVSVSGLKLFRDTYYTTSSRDGKTDAFLPHAKIPDYVINPLEKEAAVAKFWNQFWGTPSEWAPLADLPIQTMFVQPGHYLCLGDNSPESLDSRSWGVVPQRLLLGRALVVFYPFNRTRVIH